MKKTLTDRVKEYMEANGKIDQLTATYDVGTTRLSAHIYILKHDYGLPIKSKYVKTKNRYGDKIKYKEYWIDGEKTS